MIQQFHSWVYVQKKNKNANLKRYMHPNVCSGIFYNWKDMEATYAFNRWMNKEDEFDTHTHTTHTVEYYSVVKNIKFLPFVAT